MDPVRGRKWFLPSQRPPPLPPPKKPKTHKNNGYGNGSIVPAQAALGFDEEEEEKYGKFETLNNLQEKLRYIITRVACKF